MNAKRNISETKVGSEAGAPLNYFSTFPAPDKISKSNFSYDSQKDIFICPADVVLKLKSSGENRVYKAEEMVCAGCSFQKRCAAKGNNTIYTDDKGISFESLLS